MLDRAPWADLAARFGGRLEFDRPLNSLTTIGVGGPAAVLARPDTAEELAGILEICRRTACPYFVLGGGSNVVFSDQGFAGAVIKLGRAFQFIFPLGGTGLKVGAGTASARVLEEAVKLGLGGLEGLAGVPGGLGGAICMNAGSFGLELGPRVKKVDFVNSGGHREELTRPKLDFEYRRLKNLPRGGIITSAELDLTAASPPELRARINEFLARRGRTQPRGQRSAGSVFKNPPGLSAGKIIEECGLKGRSVGGAKVSEVHANFIVNQGRATGRDIRELVELVENEVRAKRGLVLEREVKLIAPDGGGEL